MKLWNLPGHRLRRLLDKGEISAMELVESVLERKQQTEPAVHAFVTNTDEHALLVARQIDATRAKGQRLGLLAGIPMALKDNICTKGIKTTCSANILADFVPPYDATVVSRLHKSGAILTGKTNMDELAMGSSTENSAFFPTHNPWDLDRVPGGSSGGSAAAVAAGQAIFALGSDTGGSIRQPAAFCSVVGLKPTYGRVSRFGLVAFASSLDQVGCLTKDVTDCALVLNSIAGLDKFDSTSAPKPVPDYKQFLNRDISGMRLGLPREFLADGVQLAVRDAVLKAATLFENFGAVVEEVSLPMVKYSPAVYYLIAPAEASSNLGRFDGIRYGLRVEGPDIDSLYKKTRSQGFGAEVRRRIMIGTYVLGADNYEAFFQKAQRVRTLIIDEFKRAFSRYDLLLTPTSPVLPFRLGEEVDDPLQMYLMDACTIPANLAGLPAISIPGGFSQGLPVGIQLMGRPWAEGTLLKMASFFEHNTDYHQQRPLLVARGEEHG
ncbi:MAG TPA: Asp-tRNA(Asn)/Glu-tRNA(Gln) amidotransferase subunit GatA [bacterium]|nr:Asp-tRNA(Asn)/Glu-tRNA(Gln) amidotransferase subunit GatA [bacterium]